MGRSRKPPSNIFHPPAHPKRPSFWSRIGEDCDPEFAARGRHGSRTRRVRPRPASSEIQERADDSASTRGCYASGTIAPDVLAALKAGKQMKVSFQTMNKETITIPMPLADFAPAYDKIK
jgi:hypothetical protein